MLEKVIVIFRYLQDKDVFENFYKTHLSKRLLGGRSVSDEVRSAAGGTVGDLGARGLRWCTFLVPVVLVSMLVVVVDCRC